MDKQVHTHSHRLDIAEQAFVKIEGLFEDYTQLQGEYEQYFLKEKAGKIKNRHHYEQNISRLKGQLDQAREEEASTGKEVSELKLTMRNMTDRL